MTVRIERRGKVEPLARRFVRFMAEALGGEALDDLQAPTERRADYRCLRGLLAVEVKSLAEDASERLSNLTDELEQRDDWPLFYGTWPLDSVIANLNDPEAVKRRAADGIGRAIIDHLRKANKQLAAHASAFPRASLVGLVAVVNEDHEVYNAAMAVQVIRRALARLEGDRPRYEPRFPSCRLPKADDASFQGDRQGSKGAGQRPRPDRTASRRLRPAFRRRPAVLGRA